MLNPGIRIELVKSVEIFSKGDTGIVQEVFKSRGDPTIFNCTINGYEGRYSFYESELRSLEAKARTRRADVSDLV